ncbi:MAG: 16S rRNA (guanine(527)-N(7))-methyltransferase RsmG [Candidatus Brocadiaceae bacterium]|nr:16S rRNA (guanine(527)-N(7))-methyltransferase RsmG [Candidatus Brocadiaceae bacterium]
MNIQIEHHCVDQFAIYAAELMKWNKNINLTAITSPVEIAVKHFLDSIAPAHYIKPMCSLLDIGSGGGFPGIPLKIILPSLSVTLIDARAKKVTFQKHIINVLKLQNTKACHGRAEDFCKSQSFTNPFDVIICRALSSFEKFVSVATPLLAKGGSILAMRGRDTEDDIKKFNSFLLKSFSAQDTSQKAFSLSVKKFTLPFIKAERTLFILKFT